VRLPGGAARLALAPILVAPRLLSAHKRTAAITLRYAASPRFVRRAVVDAQLTSVDEDLPAVVRGTEHSHVVPKDVEIAGVRLAMLHRMNNGRCFWLGRVSRGKIS